LEEKIMRTAKHPETKSHTLPDVIQATIAEHLYAAYNDAESLIGNLDRWTHQRITDENLAKVALVLESDDPAEACYRDLVREIDTEAETGIYLARHGVKSEHLQHVNGEPGVSGQLYLEMETIAPILFPEEAARSLDDLDLVWISIQACHDRAHLDASVSEIIMGTLMNDAAALHDMTSVMRALTYTYQEDVVRRCCELPVLLEDIEIRDLRIMVTELKQRSGNYEDRASEIRRKADSLYRTPVS
jgi:hypothetical protein